ncbi:hypothetical protein V5O48_014558 [Marasmius crinis-equi]|uniref:Transposase n=1 Tax=Marasmius crinis-equi TaxID=585013 RepID=A0ABR3EWZ0_9AGAR
MNVQSLLCSEQRHSVRSPPSPPPSFYEGTSPSKVSFNVSINSQVTLASLSHYPIGSIPQYLETSSSLDDTNPEGHLFDISASEWTNPLKDVLYSKGEPKGTKKEATFVKVLTDENGNCVPCTRRMVTCQGCKVCPHVNMIDLQAPHTYPAPHAFHIYRSDEEHDALSSPTRDVMEETISLWATYRDRGCLAPLLEDTVFTADEETNRKKILAVPEKARRGHASKATCEGRLRVFYSKDDLYLQCEHYKPTSKNHLSRIISPSRYSCDYFAALMNNNRSVIQSYETRMKNEGYGPLVPCRTVRNFASMTVKCDNHHRNAQGDLLMAELQHLPCKSKFITYQPHKEYRQSCCKILIVCKGPHTHPIPIPSKTPTSIREDLHRFFLNMKDLANLTTRRLLRNEAARMYLETKLPHIAKPTFLDLHPSLNNRGHIQCMINYAQSKRYPNGTGWEGVLQMFWDTQMRPSEERYLRYAGEHSLGDDDSEPFRLVICMRHSAMHRLVGYARHIQSDISFKRVVGWLEFELGGFDRSLKSSVCYVRVFLNRQSAEAHRIMLLKVHQIIQEETGKELKFRHLHSGHKDETAFEGILSWTVDQHGGQAKGIGEYLAAISPLGKFDLYERRLLSSLNPYEHLQRIIRICIAHFFRNIQETHCDKGIQTAMRSLVCVRHQDWDGTVGYIESHGNKKAKDWLADKVRSKFAFPALCWEKSLIPLDIWQATDGTSNVIESMHFDVLREGGHSTLLGGILTGKNLDEVQAKTAKTTELTGVPRRNRMTTPSSRQLNAAMRQERARSQRVDGENDKIRQQNKDLRKAKSAMLCAKQKVRSSKSANEQQQTHKEWLKAREKFVKLRSKSDGMAEEGLGSGEVEIDLCDSDESVDEIPA